MSLIFILLFYVELLRLVRSNGEVCALRNSMADWKYRMGKDTPSLVDNSFLWANNTLCSRWHLKNTSALYSVFIARQRSQLEKDIFASIKQINKIGSSQKQISVRIAYHSFPRQIYISLSRYLPNNSVFLQNIICSIAARMWTWAVGTSSCMNQRKCAGWHAQFPENFFFFFSYVFFFFFSFPSSSFLFFWIMNWLI